MSAYLPQTLRQRLLAADDHRCAYCQTTSQNTGQPMTVEHILPRSKNGATDFENLCYACRRCNEFKGSTVVAKDPLSGRMTSLYHPRRQNWDEHFTWKEQGVRILGKTIVGRATVVVLNMNNEYIINSRRIWSSAGWHPPGAL